MNTNDFARKLRGKDLRTIKQNNVVINLVKDQKSFDELFKLVFHHERTLASRAIDAVEKLTIKHRGYLQTHKAHLFSVLKSAAHIEVKWHTAQLISRMDLNRKEIEFVWHILEHWARDKNESKIVRVNSLQGLFDLSRRYTDFTDAFEKILESIDHDKSPSIQARIRKIKSSRHKVM